MGQSKTLAMRVLEGQGADYTTYDYDPALRDAAEIAPTIGIAPERVFKTLVVMPPAGSKKPLLVMVPATAQLDLKKLAAAVGAKKLKMATHDEAEQLTGLQVGGISALALLNRGFQCYLDQSARDHDSILVSSGEKGTNLEVAVPDLVRIVNARWAAVGDSSP